MSRMYHDTIYILKDDLQLLIMSLIATFNCVEITDHNTILIRDNSGRKDFKLTFNQFKLIEDKQYISYCFTSFTTKNRISDFVTFITNNKINFQFCLEKERAIPSLSWR